MWMSEASAAMASSIEEIDQPDDRRLEGHVAQVVDVLVAARSAAVVVHALDDLLQRGGRAVVGCARSPRGWPAGGSRRA